MLVILNYLESATDEPVECFCRHLVKCFGGKTFNFSVNLQAIVNIYFGENSRRRPTSSKRKLMGTKAKKVLG